MPEFDYEKEIEIDKDNLELEWLNQTNRFSKYGSELVRARKKRDRIWERLKVRKAVLIKKCKKENPKATGPEIEAYYRTDKKHKELKDKLINASSDHDLMDIAVQSFRMRKYSLEQLTKLYFHEYNGDNTVAVKERIKKRSDRKR